MWITLDNRRKVTHLCFLRICFIDQRNIILVEKCILLICSNKTKLTLMIISIQFGSS